MTLPPSLALSLYCAPPDAWTTCPRKNGWVAPHFDDAVHDDMAAIALHRQRMGLPVSDAAPGCYFVERAPAPADDAIPHGFRLCFRADSDSLLMQCLVLNGGRARLIIDPSAAGVHPLWMQRGRHYVVVYDKSADAWTCKANITGAPHDA